MASDYQNLGRRLQELFPQLDFAPQGRVRVDRSRAFTIRRGELVCVPFHGSYENSLPWHFGIGQGDLRVMDLVDERQPEVDIVDIEQFLGDSLYVYIIPQNPGDSDSQLEAAYNRSIFLKALIDSSTEPVYRLNVFNCRHFATMCCTGRYVDSDLFHFPADSSLHTSGLCGKLQSDKMWGAGTSRRIRSLRRP